MGKGMKGKTGTSTTTIICTRKRRQKKLNKREKNIRKLVRAARMSGELPPKDPVKAQQWMIDRQRLSTPETDRKLAL